MENQVQVMDLSILEKVVVKGDLSSLRPEERLVYYTKVCESVGLNPLTKPFDYLQLDGKLVLYAKRDATDQLRKLHNISISITGRERIGDVYCVTARGEMEDGRSDESIGAVSLVKEEKLWDEMRKKKVPTGRILPLTADEMAMALMKAETKAKRRVTLSLSGLGMMDESEVDSISAERIEVGGGDLNSPSKHTKGASKNGKPEAKPKGGKMTTSPNPTSNPVSEKQPTAKPTYDPIFEMLDFNTGISPSGVTYGKLRVVDTETGEECILLANTPEALEQVNELPNQARFKAILEMLNGFPIIQSIQMVGDAA